jgi:hypothetical protein
MVRLSSGASPAIARIPSVPNNFRMLILEAFDANY